MPFGPPPPIESARLQLRLVEEADLPALMQVNGDAQTVRYLPYARWATMDDAAAWYRRVSGLREAGTGLQFVVIDRQAQEVIGACLLFAYEELHARAELGYVLRRDRWGSGAMREATTALIGCAFGALGLRRLEAQVDPRNAASSGLLARLGFTKEGLLRQRVVAKGEVKDLELHGLLRHEWRTDG